MPKPEPSYYEEMIEALEEKERWRMRWITLKTEMSQLHPDCILTTGNVLHKMQQLEKGE